MFRPLKRTGRSFLRVYRNGAHPGPETAARCRSALLGRFFRPGGRQSDLSRMLKVPLNEDGFFLEAHMKLRPVDFATDGIFMCGTAHSPKFIDESVAQAQAAASKALAILTRKSLEGLAAVAEVDESLCGGCRVCEITCPYGAVKKDEERESPS